VTKQRQLTPRDFNEKYKDYLEEGQYGLDIDDAPEVVEFLDDIFQTLIQLPNFSYSQIKTKFYSVRFYCEGVSPKLVTMIEDRIAKFLFL